MALPRDLALSDEQLDQMLASTWNMRIATAGPGDRINLTPMWFGWAGGCIYFVGRGQKIVNLRRNPNATILVDLNDRFPELMGAMFVGRGVVLEDRAAEDADPHLEEVRVQMGHKYAGGHSNDPAQQAPVRNAFTAAGRSRRWVRFEVDKLVTWDNHKLGMA